MDPWNPGRYAQRFPCPYTRGTTICDLRARHQLVTEGARRVAVVALADAPEKRSLRCDVGEVDAVDEHHRFQELEERRALFGVDPDTLPVITSAEIGRASCREGG